MARVLLTREQCRDDDLPAVCAKCGAEAESRVSRWFTWCPWWVIFFLVLSLPVLLIAYLLIRKRMLVRVPLCDLHVDQWRRFSAFGWTGVLSSVGTIVAAILIDAAGGTQPLVSLLGGTGVVGIVACLIAVGVWRTFLIHPDRITRDDILLSGVAPEFGRAVKAMRGEVPAPRDYGEYDDDDRPARGRRSRYEGDEVDVT